MSTQTGWSEEQLLEKARLERIVHARPDGAEGEARQAEATEALRRLIAVVEADQLEDAQLQAARSEAAAPIEPARTPVVGLRVAVGLVGAAVATLLLIPAVLAVTTPRDSLEIFDRPQTTREADYEVSTEFIGEPLPALPGTTRVLDESDNYLVLVYMMDGRLMGTDVDTVCLMYTETGGASGGCSTLEDFQLHGVNGASGMLWGPTGGIRFTNP